MNTNTAAAPLWPATLNFGNLALVIGGAAMLFYGLYRIVGFRLTKGFFLLNAPLAAMIVIGLCYLIAYSHPAGAYGKWLFEASRYGLSFMPMMTLLVFVMGLGVVIISIHQHGIRTFMMAHPFTGTVAAIFMSPTSNALIPIVQDLWTLKGMQPYMCMYLQGSALASLPLFFLQITGFPPGTGIPPRMYATGFIATMMMLAFMQPIYWLTEMLCRSGIALWDKL